MIPPRPARRSNDEQLVTSKKSRVVSTLTIKTHVQHRGMPRACASHASLVHTQCLPWADLAVARAQVWMAGSSSDDPFRTRHDEDADDADDPSMALARQLQEEEDAILALSLQDAEPPPAARSRPPGAAASPATASRGRLPGEVLAGTAHKAIQHLGKGTAKKLEAHFKRQPLTLRETLELFNGPRREELLMLIDAGQRQRVEAELVALSLDFPV